MNAFIDIQDIQYRPATLAPEKPNLIDGISYQIEQGEFIAIIGKNGSGKTTLIKLLNGLLSPTKGSIHISGLDTRDLTNSHQLRSLTGMVFQNPADQIVASTVAEDVAFGLENLNLPSQIIQTSVAEQLIQVGLVEETNRPPHLLSGGQIQKLALAGVMIRKPKILLFDEPTSMLDPLSRELFMESVHQLHQQGMTIVYVTHHMEEAVFADKVIALNTGKIAFSGTPHEVFNEDTRLYEADLEMPESARIANQLRSLGVHLKPNILTREELLENLPSFQASFTHAAPHSTVNAEPASHPIISIKDLHYTYLARTPHAKKALFGVNLDVISSNIHGIAGTNGSGKSTLLQHINGILRGDNGSVTVGKFLLEDPATRLREVIKKVGLVFQNPETQFFETYVGDEIAYGPKQFGLDDLSIRVREAMTNVGLDFEALKDRRLETMSGGEKRKVALASTLVLGQDILLFDEPTAGMDPKSREEILTLFCQLQYQGKTIVIASHRLEELAEITQYLSLMQSGKVVKTGPSQAIFSDPQTIMATGLLPPLATIVSQKLITRGWPIQDSDTSTPDQLCMALQGLVS